MQYTGNGLRNSGRVKMSKPTPREVSKTLLGNKAARKLEHETLLVK
jgi:hypothetical protein